MTERTTERLHFDAATINQDFEGWSASVTLLSPEGITYRWTHPAFFKDQHEARAWVGEICEQHGAALNH